MVTVAAVTTAPRPSLTSALRLVVGLVAELVTVTVALTSRVEEPVPARLRSIAVPDVPPEAAVRWALKAFQQDGLAARREAVKVPHWVRGEESGEILPAAGVAGHRLALTALGNSVGGDATAEVVEARSLAEVASLGPAARGKIVFFNHTMKAPDDYGRFVELRSRG